MLVEEFFKSRKCCQASSLDLSGALLLFVSCSLWSGHRGDRWALSQAQGVQETREGSPDDGETEPP